jgi:hypothetical protein
MIAPSASLGGQSAHFVLEMVFLVHITHMATNCWCGKAAILMLYAHGTDQSNSVAIVRLADIVASEGERNRG